jgi:hypothetical protein
MRPRLLTNILLGAASIAITFGGAIGLALLADLTSVHGTEMVDAAAIERLDAIWSARRPPGYPDRPEMITLQRSFGYSSRYAYRNGDDAHHSLVWLEAGWPRPALHGAYWRVRHLAPDPALDGAPMVVGHETHKDGATMLVASQVPLLALSSPRLLPLHVAWVGAAVDAALVFAVLWMLTWGLIQLRARRRLRAGRCPACGYPFGEPDRCAECGRPRDAPRRGTA